MSIDRNPTGNDTAVSIEVVSLPPIPQLRHAHEEVEIVFALRGRIAYETSLAQGVLEEGEFLYLNSSEKHSLGSSTCEPGGVLEIMIKPIFFRLLGQSPDMPEFYCSSGTAKNSGTVPAWVVEHARNSLQEMYLCKEVLRNPAGFAPILLSLLSVLMKHLPHVTDSPRPAAGMDETPARMANIVMYLQSHFREEVSVEKIAATNFMSVSHLCHAFKKYMGMSIGQYLTDIRLSKAKEMLLSNRNEFVTAIVMECGFRNLSRFYAVFNRAMGCNPQEYRRAHLQEVEGASADHGGSDMTYIPLTRSNICKVIEGRGQAERIPNLVSFWVHPWTFGDREPEVRELMGRFPMDVQIVPIRMPSVYTAPADAPEYRWVDHEARDESCAKALDADIAIQDWSELDCVLAKFPDARYPGMLPEHPVRDGRYRLACWFYCFFERHWSLRGMTNALMDFYTDPEEVHRLYSALADFYCILIERVHDEEGADGIFTSDDIGMQTGPFFSTDIFDEFFKPYYQRIIDKAHSFGMHFWLHACGNIESFLPGLIEIGLDVVHPIQKYAMEEKRIAEKFGQDICLLAGFDVQQIIPWGTPEEVRQEVRFMFDTYRRPDGRLMFTAGNGVNGDCTIASLEALYDESITYGRRRETCL